MRVNLTPGSEDWHLWRAQGIGGSDVSALTGSSPWTKPFHLWEMKTGRRERPDLSENFAVQKGLRLEPIAREMYEEKTGNVMPEGCYIDDTDGRFKASLDGISFDETLVLEIKVPGLSTHEGCKAGVVPPHYNEQMQWYMGITGALQADFVTLYYYGEMPDLAIHRVMRDELLIAEMRVLAATFMDHVESDTPPGYTDTDVEDVSADDEWIAWESSIADIDVVMDGLKKEREAIYANMKKRAEFHGVKGTKYQMTRAVTKGAIDYAKWTKENDYNVPDEYRKPSTIRHTLRKVK